MSGAVLPFLTIPDEFVDASAWNLSLSTGIEFDDPEFVPNWDNGADLTLRRSFSVDLAGAMKALGHESNGAARLELAVLVGTGAGPLPEEKWVACRAPLSGDGLPVEVTFTESGEQLASVLYVESVIFLSSGGGGAEVAIAPKHAGSILWQEKRRIRIEGDETRFPVSETDLGLMLGNTWQDSLWCLDVDWSDPEAEFDASVRLHINSRKTEFANRFKNGDPATLQAVMADAMTQIAGGYLSLDDHWEGLLIDSSDRTTLASVAAYWLELAFGSVETGRQVFRKTPAKFHACLNALATQQEGTE